MGAPGSGPALSASERTGAFQSGPLAGRRITAAASVTELSYLRHIVVIPESDTPHREFMVLAQTPARFVTTIPTKES